MSKRWFFVDEEKQCLGVRYNNQFGEAVDYLLDEPAELQKYLTHPNNAKVLNVLLGLKSFLK